MGQETHYYNNVIAQLVELRDETKKSNEDTQVGMSAKLDEVIDAIEKIQVTAENIKIEAGTINLSTDEVEALLKTVNTNLGIINENINEFDTNVNTELEKFITKIHDEFTTFTNFITTENTAIKTLFTTKVAELITNTDEEFDKLILAINNNNDTLTNTITDEFTKVNKTISDKANTYGGLNHSDLLNIKAALDLIKTTIETELDDLQTGSDTNKNDIITKLNTIIDQIGDVSSPVEGSIVKLLRSINDNLTNSGTDNETNLTALKTAIETASTEIQTLITSNNNTIKNALGIINTTSVSNKDSIVSAVNTNSTEIQKLITNNHNVIHDDLFNNGKPIPGILRRLELIARGKSGDTFTEQDVTNTLLGEAIESNVKLKHISDATNLTKISTSDILTVVGGKSDQPDADNGSINGKLRYITNGLNTVVTSLGIYGDAADNNILTIQGKLRYIVNELPNIIDKLQTDIQISDTETVKESIAGILKLLYINFDEHKHTVENISKYSYEIDTTISKIVQLLGNDDTEGINLLLNNIIKAINDSSSTGEQISTTTNQLITDIKTLVDAIKTNDGTNTQSIVDAINAIKVTAESIKIDAGTINLSTDEVEDLLKASNANTNNIKTFLGEPIVDGPSTIMEGIEIIGNGMSVILNELVNIKNVINNQTTSITNAMTAQTEAIVNAINNITGPNKALVMVDNTPPQYN